LNAAKLNIETYFDVGTNYILRGEKMLSNTFRNTAHNLQEKVFYEVLSLTSAFTK
jgi:hypothetical protein